MAASKAPSHPGAQPPRRWLRRTLLAAGFILLIGAALAWLLRDEWFVWRFRQAARAGGAELETYRQQLDQRSDGLELAIRLSDDSDPKVRAAIIDRLVAKATPAPKVQRGQGGAFAETYQGMNDTAEPALRRLLADADPGVRQRAIHAASGIKSAYTLSEPLLQILRTGDAADRAAVCEYLAHWNGPAVLDVFADLAQPKSVRLAAIRSGDQFGWREVRTVAQGFPHKVLDDADAEIRHAAIEALRHFEKAEPAWLKILLTGPVEDRPVVVRVWIDTLANEQTGGGEWYQHLHSTEELLVQSVRDELADNGRRVIFKVDAVRAAALIHLLCEAAKKNTEQLDQTPPANELAALRERQQRGDGPECQAFALELNRLLHILRALQAVRWCLANEHTQNTEFTAWLPHEKQGNDPPPKRQLQTFVMEQGRLPLAWCRRHAGGYASRFLRVNSFFLGEEQDSGKVRTLGNVLENLQMHTDEALQHYVESRKNK